MRSPESASPSRSARRSAGDPATGRAGVRSCEPAWSCTRDATLRVARIALLGRLARRRSRRNSAQQLAPLAGASRSLLLSHGGARSGEPSRERDAMTSNPLEQVLFEVKRTIVGTTCSWSAWRSPLAGSHLLVEGAGAGEGPRGQILAGTIGSQFQRIQFTPDLVPADLVGTRVYRQHSGEFDVSSGRCSPTCCWPTRSTARPPRCRARCWRSCRSDR